MYTDMTRRSQKCRSCWIGQILALSDVWKRRPFPVLSNLLLRLRSFPHLGSDRLIDFETFDEGCRVGGDVQSAAKSYFRKFSLLFDLPLIWFSACFCSNNLFWWNIYVNIQKAGRGCLSVRLTSPLVTFWRGGGDLSWKGKNDLQVKPVLSLNCRKILVINDKLFQHPHIEKPDVMVATESGILTITRCPHKIIKSVVYVIAHN